MARSGLFENFSKTKPNWRPPVVVFLLALTVGSIGVLSLSYKPITTNTIEGILDPFAINDWAGQATAHYSGEVEITYSIAMTRTGEQQDYPITFYLPQFGKSFEAVTQFHSEVIRPSPFSDAFSRVTNSESGTLVQSVPLFGEENREFFRQQKEVWQALRYNLTLSNSKKDINEHSNILWVPMLMAGSTVTENFSFVITLPDIERSNVTDIALQTAKYAGGPAEVQFAEPLWDRNPEGALTLSYSSSLPIRAPNGIAVALTLIGLPKQEKPAPAAQPEKAEEPGVLESR